MAMVGRASVPLLIVMLLGCGTSRMYEGEKPHRTKVSLLFIHERPNLRYTCIDGRPVDFIHDGKVLEFLPGRHTFEVDISNYAAWGAGNTTTITTNFYIKSFALELEMLPGYTYSLDFQGINVSELPETLCFLGEPHDAPGSETGMEFRQMSNNAQSFSCVKSHRIRSNKDK